MHSFSEIFALLYESVGNVTASELGNTCRQIGMVEREFIDIGMNQGIPDFDNGYWFSFPLECGYIGNFEVLEADGDIVQAGIQVAFPPGQFFSKASGCFRSFREMAERAYGPGAGMNKERLEIYYFSNTGSVCFASRIKAPARDVVLLRIGNRKFLGPLRFMSLIHEILNSEDASPSQFP